MFWADEEVALRTISNFKLKKDKNVIEKMEYHNDRYGALVSNYTE